MCADNRNIMVVCVNTRMDSRASRKSVQRLSVSEKSLSACGKTMRQRMRDFLELQFAEPSENEHCAMLVVT